LPGNGDGPETRVDRVAERIYAELVRFEKARDERAIFAFAYWQITRKLAAVLRGREVPFDDPSWVVSLTEAFAARFFRAMQAIDEGQARLKTPAWADVHEAIRGGQSYVVEDLVFSMVAHIAYDLPQTLIDIGGPENVADYHRMNAVLASCTEAIQKAVGDRYNNLLAFLDHIAGRYDEFFSNYGIRSARSVAWYNAVRLRDPRSMAEAHGSIERSTRAFIRFVREPNELWVRLLVKIARAIIPRRRRWPRQPPADML